MKDDRYKGSLQVEHVQTGVVEEKTDPSADTHTRSPPLLSRNDPRSSKRLGWAQWRERGRVGSFAQTVFPGLIMNSVDLLKGIYYTHLKPEPSRISESLGLCLALVNQHSLLPQVVRLCDSSSSPLQKSALEIIRKWNERLVELMSLPSGSGEDRNRAAALVLLGQLISDASFELMHGHKDKWIASLVSIITRV